jgi:hypothetical protein
MLADIALVLDPLKLVVNGPQTARLRLIAYPYIIVGLSEGLRQDSGPRCHR